MEQNSIIEKLMAELAAKNAEISALKQDNEKLKINESKNKNIKKKNTNQQLGLKNMFKVNERKYKPSAPRPVGHSSGKAIREFKQKIAGKKISKFLLKSSKYRQEHRRNAASSKIAAAYKLSKRNSAAATRLKSINKFISEKHTYMPFADMVEQVKNKFATMDRKPFKIRIKSKTTGIEKEYKFTNYYHFKKFGEQCMKLNENQGMALDSTGLVDFQEIKNLHKDIEIFADVQYEILPLEGGCTKNTNCPLKIFSLVNYKITCDNPVTHNQNCGITAIKKLLNLNLKESEMRAQFNLKYNTKVDATTIAAMYAHYKSATDKRLKIITEEYAGYIDLAREHYIMLSNEHYRVVSQIEHKKQTDKKTKRGEIFWDIETRPTLQCELINNCKRKYATIIEDTHEHTIYEFQVNNETIRHTTKKAYILKDTITHVYLRRYKQENFEAISFSTNEQSSSCRQFLNWLTNEAGNGHYYNCIAHNCGRFDLYFLLANMTQKETIESRIQLRGYSVIGMQYQSHLFKDSFCYMTFSLEKLSESYKIQHKKLTEFEYNNQKLTNKNICFYKPELNFQEFMNLEHTEPEFWRHYNEYCMYDCISLSEIWEKFSKSVNKLIEKMSSKILSNCKVNTCNTIGSHAMKIIKKLNANSFSYVHMLQFLDYKYDATTKTEYHNKEKYDFVCNFKRGGISHCNKPGKYTENIVCYDITSQYPWSLVNMQIPAGKSEWHTEYKPDLHGFYKLRNCTFSKNNHCLFKPVASKNTDTGVLQWRNELIAELYIDSAMLKYMMSNYGMQFESVERALLSNNSVEGNRLFGTYINALYSEKEKQDRYKQDLGNHIKGLEQEEGVSAEQRLKNVEYALNHTLYNEAYRETIKLYLNAATGKLVENVSKYFQIEIYDNPEPNSKQINGAEIKKIHNTEAFNHWILAGVMVYSFSKMLLFDYISCLPHNSESVLNTETDSIYFRATEEKEFLNNLSKSQSQLVVHNENNLGGFKREFCNDDVSYFLGKKAYFIGFKDSKKEKAKLKGIPNKTIDECGNDVQIVNKQLFEQLSTGKPVSIEFATLQKELYGNTKIKACRMIRTIKFN